MTAFRYFPILKSKTGELLALEWIRPRVRASVVPVWELVPPGEKSDALATARAQAGDLVDVWGGDGHILVDPALFGSGSVAAEAVSAFFGAARGQVKAVPVYSARLGPAARAAVTAEAAKCGHGLAVRVRADDFRSIEALGAMLVQMRHDAGIGPADTDLIVDLGAIAQALPDEAVDQTAAAISRIPRLREWRSFAIASGAFLRNLSEYKPGRTYRLDRHDWDLWRRLCEPGMLPRRPEYSDYGVHHPDLPPEMKGRGRPGSPSLRYTVERQFLAVRGARSAGEPALPEQFRERCRELVTERTVNRFFSEGDERIVRCAAGTLSSGGQSHWRAVATDHHLTQVWTQLASLGDGGE